jgi:ferric-dicitrate binding protein FerR (iron transport regulator)
MYTKFTVEEFAMDPAFRQWVATPNKDSNLFWEKFLADHPDKLSAVKKAKKLVQCDWLPIDRLTTEEEEDLWKAIERGSELQTEAQDTSIIPIHSEAILQREPLHHQQQTSTAGRKRKMGWAAGIAAAVALFLLGLTLYTPGYVPTSANEVLTKKQNPRGQKLTVFLNDGSRVVLNSESSIEYKENFDVHERRISLQGEAYFIVAKDAERPFMVESRSVMVQALGTEFNVRSFEWEDEIAVGLVEGKVAVDDGSEANSGRLILQEGEMARYDRQSREIRKEKFDVFRTTAWKEGILAFRKASEQEVLQTLGQWYDVRFEVLDTANKPWDYTAIFDRQDLKAVLTSIGYTMNFRFEIDKDKVTIHYEDAHSL